MAFGDACWLTIGVTMHGLLNNVRILDLTRVLAGPYGTMLLADMGADVIKIESPDSGDPTRLVNPPGVAGISSYFLNLNRNKRSLALDLRTDHGRAAFYTLVADADVVIDNFRPGITERLSVHPEALVTINPRIITCSMSAYGPSGPYKNLPAFDLILQAMGGAMSITGDDDGAPMRMGLPMGDLGGGMFAAMSIAAALFERERSGRGRHIDLSLLDIQVSLLNYVGAAYLHSGEIPTRVGSGHHSIVPYQAFQTADAWIVIGIFPGTKAWPPFCEAIGLAELAEQYPENEDRVAARDVLVPILEAQLKTKTADDWAQRLKTADVTVGRIQTIDQVMRDPQVLHQQMVAAVDPPHPVAGAYAVVGNPVRTRDAVTGETEALTYRPAPELGEANAELLGEPFTR